MIGIDDYMRAAREDGDAEAVDYYERQVLDHEEAEGDRRREETADDSGEAVVAYLNKLYARREAKKCGTSHC